MRWTQFALADENLKPKVMRWTRFALADQNLNPTVMKWTQFALADQSLNPWEGWGRGQKGGWGRELAGVGGSLVWRRGQKGERGTGLAGAKKPLEAQIRKIGKFK